MDNEQKNDLRVLGGIKAKMIKWGIGAIVVMIALVIIFITGYSNATKKYEDIIADLSQEVELKFITMLTKQSSNGNILGKFALQIKNITVYGS